MIELIFAIVLIAVVMLTIPTMIQVNNKALEGNAAQEAIFLVSSVLSEATTQLWDASSVDADGTTVRLSKVLDVNGTGDAAYDRWDQTDGELDVNSTVRKGGLEQDLHRMFFSAETRPEQAAGAAVTLPGSFNAAATGTQLGLKTQYTITATRVYVDDNTTNFVFSTANAGKQTNIKMTLVEINATVDGTPTVISRLRAYTCNIGEIDYAKRRF
jgi:hypothetical protein